MLRHETWILCKTRMDGNPKKQTSLRTLYSHLYRYGRNAVYHALPPFDGQLELLPVGGNSAVQMMGFASWVIAIFSAIFLSIQILF